MKSYDAQLSAKIEQHLLTRSCWVPTAELCALFGLTDDRPLRQDGRREGLCTRYAITHSHKGLKHVTCATTEEWLQSKHSLRRHGIQELRRVARLERRRRNVSDPQPARPGPLCERDTGQGLLQEIIA